MDRLVEQHGGTAPWPCFGVDVAGLARAFGCPRETVRARRPARRRSTRWCRGSRDATSRCCSRSRSLPTRASRREGGAHARVPPAARADRAARPEPVGPNDVLVRIGGAGVCATDLHAIEGLMESAGVTLPRVLGHENAGWVEEVGDGVTTVAKGDAVLVYPPYSCGLCVACRRGNDMHCAATSSRAFGRRRLRRLRPRPGALAPALPDGVEPADVAPHADAGPDRLPRGPARSRTSPFRARPRS